MRKGIIIFSCLVGMIALTSCSNKDKEDEAVIKALGIGNKFLL